MAQSPFLISYFLLIVPLHLLGIGPHNWVSCLGRGPYNNCGWHVQDWHLNFLAITFAAILQPTGSLLLAPASPRQSFISRLNPVIGMAEGMSTLFTLLALHFSPNPMSYPAAATLTLYRREASSLTPTQLDDLSSNVSNKQNYHSIRKSLGFSPLQPRSITASASLYIFGLLALIRFMLNKWLYSDAPVITMLCFHFVVSFGFLHLAIVIATSRALTPEEHQAVEEQFQTYLVTHHLQHSLAPGTSAKKPRRTNFDDSWTRVLIFLASYIFLTTTTLILLKLIVKGPPRKSLFRNNSGPKWPFYLFPHGLEYFLTFFPRTLFACFMLMKLSNWKPRLGKWAYWSVALGLVVHYYSVRFAVVERLYFRFFWHP